MEMSTLEGIFSRVAKEAPNMDGDQIDSLITELASAVNPNTTNTEIKKVAARYGVELDNGPVKDSSGSAFLAMALCALVQAEFDDTLLRPATSLMTPMMPMPTTRPMMPTTRPGNCSSPSPSQAEEKIE